MNFFSWSADTVSHCGCVCHSFSFETADRLGQVYICLCHFCPWNLWHILSICAWVSERMALQSDAFMKNNTAVISVLFTLGCHFCTSVWGQAFLFLLTGLKKPLFPLMQWKETKSSLQEQLPPSQPHSTHRDRLPPLYLLYYLQPIPQPLMGSLLNLVGSPHPLSLLPLPPGWILERHQEKWSAQSKSKVMMTWERKDLLNSSMNTFFGFINWVDKVNWPL